MASIEDASRGKFPEFPFQSGIPIQDLVIHTLKAKSGLVVLPTRYTQSTWLRSDVLVAPRDASSAAGYPAGYLDEITGIIEDRIGISVERSDSWDVGITNRDLPLPRAVRVGVEPLAFGFFPSGAVILGQEILEYDYLQRTPDKDAGQDRIASGLPFLETHFWVAPNEDVARHLLETASPIDGVSVAKATHLPTDGSIPFRIGWGSWRASSDE